MSAFSQSAITVSFPARALIKDGHGTNLPASQNLVSIRKLSKAITYVSCEIALDENTWISDIDIPVKLIFQDSSILNNSKKNFHWIPGINTASAQIISDHLFRSPAMIYALEKSSLVLIPDIEEIPDNRPAPYYMQVKYSDKNIELHYGLSDFETVRHVYFRRSTRQFTLSRKLKMGFYLLTPKTKDPLELLKTTNAFLWNRFAKKYTSSTLPQVVNFEKYAEVGYGMALNHYWVNVGKDKGGITLSTLYDDSSKSYRGRDSKDDLWFQSWFNNLRTAYGLYYWGVQSNNPEWKDKAMKTVDLLMGAPTNRGWFPTIFNTEKNSWIPSSQMGGSVYHVPDNAWTAYWLMRFSDEMQKIKGADKFLVGLGAAMLKSQNEKGSFPTMVHAKSLDADSVLMNTASSAIATWYLEELVLRNKIRPDSLEIYKKAILKSLDFLSSEILPMQKFEDFESYFSCSPKPMHYFDTTTNMFCQNTMSIQWCAEAYLKAYTLFSDKKYLASGEYCLNILSLYQQVWNPPFINLYAFGGFGAQNTDAEWSDARQAQFADTYLQYYHATGNKEYLERGMAACRASFALMVLPENKSVCPNNYAGTDVNGESWPGTMAENYGHSGYDERSFQSGFHWGTGSALTTAAIFIKEIGKSINRFKK